MFTVTRPHSTTGEALAWRYLTLDDVTAYLAGPAPRPRNASGYGEVATVHRLRCAVGDDARILTRRVYVLCYGNGGGLPYVYGRVSGERVRFYLDPEVSRFVDDMTLLDVLCTPVTNRDVRDAAQRDGESYDGYGYADRLYPGGGPRTPLRTYDTSRADDVGRLTREGRLYLARREYDV
ncbi:hypothetical protein QLT00_gp88 [Gordonia phage Commandaria]|uniref:Uncharacterized protein n=1 Tax=Gordonia phage Commandaria TaxID=3038364 RepID=A0AAF0GKW6_9CAUD|nr:hypothetical protein QLT00_gp88 [Gordonia phage Commandaria]WGH20871.1 hypothetical protein [Gordonia phage Commandaria]